MTVTAFANFPTGVGDPWRFGLNEFSLRHARRKGDDWIPAMQPWDPFQEPGYEEKIDKRTGVSSERGTATVNGRILDLVLWGEMDWAPSRWGFELYPTFKNLGWPSDVEIRLASFLSPNFTTAALVTPSTVHVSSGTPLLFGNQCAVLARSLRYGDLEVSVLPTSGSLAGGETIHSGSVTRVPRIQHTQLTRAVLWLKAADLAVSAALAAVRYKVVMVPELEELVQQSTEGRFVMDPDTKVLGFEIGGVFYSANRDEQLVKRTAARVLLGEL